MAVILDFKDILEANLIKYGCKFKLYEPIFCLEEDSRYSIKTIKLPKFDSWNMSDFITILEYTVKDIIYSGGSEYKTIFDDINNAEW